MNTVVVVWSVWKRTFVIINVTYGGVYEWYCKLQILDAKSSEKQLQLIVNVVEFECKTIRIEILYNLKNVSIIFATYKDIYN